MSIINGMKVCASRSETLSYATATRASYVSENTSSNSMTCPDGFKLCNAGLAPTLENAEKSICIEESLDVAESCPITRVEFSLDQHTASEAQKF